MSPRGNDGQYSPPGERFALNLPRYRRGVAGGAGKALARKRSEIVIHFKQAPLAIVRDTPVNRRAGGVKMKFRHQDYFKVALSTGYETLRYDCTTVPTRRQH